MTQRPTEEELNRLTDQLAKQLHGPGEEFSAEKSYPLLQRRIRTPVISFLRYASAVAAVVTLAFLLVLKLNQSHKYQSLATTDQIREFVLNDGSRVILGRYSTLEYPEKFGDQRKVSLNGEAYFEVRHNPEHPFVVKADKINVTVLGTKFNVQAYPGQSSIRTTLMEGSVAVRREPRSEPVILKPNESALFYCKTNEFDIQEEKDATDRIAWKDNILLFRQATVSEIAERLSSYFHTEITVANEKLQNYRLSARFEQGETLREILHLLQEAGNFNFREENNTVIIY